MHSSPKVYPDPRSARPPYPRRKKTATPVRVRTDAPRLLDDPREYEGMGASPICTYMHTRARTPAYPYASKEDKCAREGDAEEDSEGGMRTGTRASPSLRVRGYVRGPAQLEACAFRTTQRGRGGKAGRGRGSKTGTGTRTRAKAKARAPDHRLGISRSSSNRHPIPIRALLLLHPPGRQAHEIHEVRETDKVHTCGEVAAVAASQACTDFTALPLAHEEEEGDLCSFHGKRAAAEAKRWGASQKAASRAEDAEMSVVHAYGGIRQGFARPHAATVRTGVYDR
ncbi:hypothetical protein B0H13DRAFT_2376980 [Mycena leptocephala]|nr:hypothetical protein B0H13DRAFT_2376980 [Mycena leptocephala]